MMLSNISQRIVDVSSDVGMGSLNSSDDLTCSDGECPDWTYLRNEIVPSLDFYGRKPGSHCMTYILVRSILEPKCQEA
jgi:hypothetical protein